MVLRDQEVIQVVQAVLDLKEMMVLMELMEHKDQEVTPEHKDHKVIQLQGQEECKGLLVLLGVQALKVTLVIKVFKA